MGSGKTTIGRAMARHLGKRFADCDEEIIKRTGVSITHIFDVEGEVGFRQREASVIQDLTQHENIVLATGGGAVMAEQNRELLCSNGIVIYLKAGVNELWQRTRHDRNRPLLQTDDPHAKIKELFQQRDPLYRDVADIVVLTGKQSAHTLMLHIADEVEKYRKLSRKVIDEA